MTRSPTSTAPNPMALMAQLAREVRPLEKILWAGLMGNFEVPPCYALEILGIHF